MATGGLSSSQVSEITECLICADPFKEPKVLPCIHTFCLHCLEKYGEENNPGDRVNCPLCRKQFIIPLGGFRELPNNYFIIQLMQFRQSPDGPSIDQPQRKLTQSLGGCEQHPSKEIEFYCCDCKTTACAACFKEKHKEHKWTDIEETAKEFSKQLRNDIEKVAPYILKNQEELKKIEEDRKVLISKVKLTKLKISMKYDQLLALLDSYRDKLIAEVDSHKEEMLKALEEKKKKSEMQLLSLESFKRDCKEMEKKWTSCDISHAADDLHMRAEELSEIQEELFGRSDQVLSVDIDFTPPDTTSGNWFGKLTFLKSRDTKTDKVATDKDLNSLSLFKETSIMNQPVVNLQGPIADVAVVGNQLFLVRSDVPDYAEVYDSNNLTAAPRQLKIGDTKNVRGFLCIAGCSQYNCVYVSRIEVEDQEKAYIHRIELSNNTVTKWIVGACEGLSVTNNHRLLVTFFSGRVEEYTTHGTLIRKISFYINYGLRHCVELADSNFVVIDEYLLSIFDASGRILRSYGGDKGSGYGQLNNPTRLAVDRHDNVLVLDKGNNRVLLLSSQLTFLGNITLADVPGYLTVIPGWLCLDKTKNRLYV